MQILSIFQVMLVKLPFMVELKMIQSLSTVLCQAASSMEVKVLTVSI